MRFAVAVQGTRGDIEPCAAVALELMRRDHEVIMAVPPNLVEFTKSTGLPNVVSYGPDSRTRALSWSVGSLARWNAQRYGADSGQDLPWLRLHNPIRVLSHLRAYLTDSWAEMGARLEEFAAEADLILTGMTYQEVAANVAEHRGIPFAALHFCPVRPSTQTLPVRLPVTVVGPLLAASEWAYWRILKPADDAQRTALGLPPSITRAQERIEANGALEIQAYDPVFYPGLEAEWGGRRPFVGSMTLQRSSVDDGDVLTWIEAGNPPIYFGLGSMPVEKPAVMLAMIKEVCDELGERALVCSSDLTASSSDERVIVVSSVNHSKVFPRCRAVVHHGGSGTTAAAARAGVPSVILWVGADQPSWAARIEKLGIGIGHRFGTTSPRVLLRLLRTVLAPNYKARASKVAEQMIPPAQSVYRTATLLEAAVLRSTKK